ncbi:tetratricopeptide repeat protein [Streptomyces phaeolivaceus]|uniref:Tetratricopeptide repeat protein n=1 Tax=Streptomyces phaeolivaceus TaxID=2653200 RepID=A0A5P8K8L2_9ACTN|nr:tetratricopeptide repeat protein [Streptomyces phaeolivaceus]QFQ99152.1 tetratricopeptide repeat protein [Streptomyces phaeolivaceus]
MSDTFDRRPVDDPSVTASGAGSVAARGDVGLAQTGAGSFGVHIDNATLLSAESFPAAASVHCPQGLGNLPSRAPLFVGRDHELGLLDQALVNPGEAVVHAVHGLGGIGKSMLAARWATLRGAEYAPVWWITADSRAALDAGLAALAAALQPTLVTLLPQEQLGEWARQWLASHTGWLIVLDNVSDPADVEHLLARATSGRFLITSRRSTGWRSMAREVPLDVLSEEEAVDLFTRIRGMDPDTAALCEELGHLPLAVAQAAAYCVETGCAVREYLDDLAAYPAEMYEATDEGGDHQRAVARVWHITLDRLADDPLAVRILLMLAWYASEGIPRSLLAALGTPPAVRRALRRLAAHSMITLHDDTVSVHRLVQAVSRTPGQDDRHRHADAITAARGDAIAALAGLIPQDADAPEAWRAVRAVLPHVEALAGHGLPGAGAGTAGSGTETAGTGAEADLYVDTARQLAFSGTRAAARAVVLLERAEEIHTRSAGAEASRTLETRIDLVHARKRSGDLEQSVPRAEAVLADCVRVLGERHPVTLTALMRLAKSVGFRGDSGRAKELLEEVVAGRRSEFGDRHPRTLEARGFLAMEFRDHGDLVSVRPRLQQVYDDCVEYLGAEHPVTLSIQGDLLVMSPGSRMLEGPLGEALVSASLTDPGLDFADLMSRFDSVTRSTGLQGLKTALGSEGDVRAAKEYVATHERVYGSDHPKTLTARMSLVQAYASTRDVGRVSAVLEQLVSDATQVFGGDDVFVTGVNAIRSIVDAVLSEGLVDSGEADDPGAGGAEREELHQGSGAERGRDPETLARLGDLYGSVRESLASGKWDVVSFAEAAVGMLRVAGGAGTATDTAGTATGGADETDGTADTRTSEES